MYFVFSNKISHNYLDILLRNICWVRFDQCADNIFSQKSKNIYRISRKIFWVRFDQKFGYVLVDWVRFDQKSGYDLTKIGYVLVRYVLAWVRFDHKRCSELKSS